MGFALITAIGGGTIAVLMEFMMIWFCSCRLYKKSKKSISFLRTYTTWSIVGVAA